MNWGIAAFGRFRRSSTGSTALVFALSAVVWIGIAAFAVDLGNLYVQRRRVQSVADLAALAAASNLTQAYQFASGTVSSNGVQPDGGLIVETGVYAPDPKLTPDQRFTVAAAAVSNAARVKLTTQVTQLGFGRIFTGDSSFAVSRSAIAANTAVASFAIGSRLARLDSGILNQLIGASIGGNVNLSVMDYQSMMSARVDLFDFLSAAAVRAQISGGTYASLLQGKIQLGSALSAIAGASSGAGASQALSQIGAAAGTGTVGLGSIIDLGPYANLPIGQKPSNSVSVSAFDLMDAVARLGGQNQAAMKLALDVPGIAQASLSVAVGQPPAGSSWVAVGSVGASVHTAQTRLFLDLTLTPTGQFTSLSLPVYIEVAQATASLNKLQCRGTDPSPNVTLGVSTGAVDAWIGRVTSDQLAGNAQVVSPTPAVLARAGLLTVTGSANVQAASGSNSVTFGPTDIGSQTPKTVSASSFSGSLVTSLLSNLSIDVSLGGLKVPLPGGTAALNAALSPVAASTDTTLQTLLSYYGVGIGQADVWVNGVRCDGAALVY